MHSRQEYWLRWWNDIVSCKSKPLKCKRFLQFSWCIALSTARKYHQQVFNFSSCVARRNEHSAQSTWSLPFSVLLLTRLIITVWLNFHYCFSFDCNVSRRCSDKHALLWLRWECTMDGAKRALFHTNHYNAMQRMFRDATHKKLLN